jgi:hypothetical protein
MVNNNSPVCLFVGNFHVCCVNGRWCALQAAISLGRRTFPLLRNPPPPPFFRALQVLWPNSVCTGCAAQKAR